MTFKIVAGCHFAAAPTDQSWLALARVDGLGAEITELKHVPSHKIAHELSITPHLASCGINFPFSVPADFMEILALKAPHAPFQSWQEVVEQVVFTDYETFGSLAKELKKDGKRITETGYGQTLSGPLSAANIHRTYAGMRMLAGLDPSKFCIVPFQDQKPDTCTVLEVSSKALLRCLDLPSGGFQSQTKKDEDKAIAKRKELITSLIELREKKGIACRDYPRLSIDKKFQHEASQSEEAMEAVIACYTMAIWLDAPQLFEDPFAQDDINVLLEGWIFAPTKTAVGSHAK
jgi:hypothetical protein